MRKFVLVGRTGVGKSSFINSVFGQYIAETSKYEACTKIVQHHAYNSPLGDICLIDTPGLAEDDIDCDRKYLDLIKSSINFDTVDALIYISRLDETRFRPDEKRTIRLLTEKLGVFIWNKAWLIFTFSASVYPEKRQIVTINKKKQIEDFVRSITSDYGLNPPFQGFQVRLRVDNISKNWTSKSLPIMPILHQHK
ncbi:GTPase [Nostoc sp. CCY0012]|uniref:GTPase n=1 Tax=Nostoc sp. CCY0012 TaxID=1056123 RepID=UPI0039C7003F